MTEQKIYEKFCAGCPNEVACHENCEVCDMVAEMLEETEGCKTCRFFHKLKEFRQGEWTEKSVCTMFPQTEKGYNAFALVVSGNDRCEAYERERND